MSDDFEYIKERLAEALDDLPELDRLVVNLRYGIRGDLAQQPDEVARRLLISLEDVARAETSGLRQLDVPLVEDEEESDSDSEEESSSSSESSEFDLVFGVETRDLVEAEHSLNPYLIAHLRSHEDDLHKLDPYVFEHLIAEFFASWGYDDVRLVGRDKSTAADVFAMRKEEPLGEEVRYFVEVKRSKYKVGIEVINSVLGAVSGERDRFGWHIALIVSLAGFTESRRYSNLTNRRIVLRTKDDVIAWLMSYEPDGNGLWLPGPLRTMEGL